MRIDELRKKLSIVTKWVAFPLHPEIPEDGLALTELFKGADTGVNKVRMRLKEAVAELGLPFSERTKTYNTRLVQELAKWAETQRAGEAFRRAVFKAYFVDGVNIGKVDDLVGIAEDLGLSGEAAREALRSGTHQYTVDDDCVRAREMGITAVPTFVMRKRESPAPSPTR